MSRKPGLHVAIPLLAWAVKGYAQDGRELVWSDEFGGAANSLPDACRLTISAPAGGRIRNSRRTPTPLRTSFRAETAMW
jgi:hypothetical protein